MLFLFHHSQKKELRTLICFCFSYFDWLGGGAYFDGMEDLEAGKFKQNDKFKILNEKLHDLLTVQLYIFNLIFSNS